MHYGEKPSRATIEALEPSLLIYLDTLAFEKLARNRPGLLRMKIRNMGDALLESADRIYFYTNLSPEERYCHVRDTMPKLIDRVPQKHLASYIGITPVSLSRIKARLGGYIHLS